jgi:hypothetical protein
MRIAALSLCALALAGCGGHSGPSIDAALAAKLARQADAVAAAKDACAARTHAQILQRQTIAATNAGRIPTVFQEPLLGRVNELVGELELRCLPVPAASTPAPEPPPTPVFRGPAHGHEKHHGHGHGHGHGHRGDD